MCHKCEEKKTCSVPKSCDLEVTKKLIYLCEKPPLEIDVDVEIVNGIEIKIGVQATLINSCFAYVIALKNDSDSNIDVTSIIDPLLTVNGRRVIHCFIHFSEPKFSDKYSPNPCWPDSGELINEPLVILPKCTLFVTIKGKLMCKKLNLCNFVFVKYEKNGVANSVQVSSPELKLEVELPVVGPAGPTGPTGPTGPSAP